MTDNHMSEPGFEAALDRLEEIVEQIEGEELELGESLALFEEGVRLLRAADAQLSAAELRVQQLFEDGDAFRLEEFAEER
jgi:exodeoxyribonuclease VII small subunit